MCASAACLLPSGKGLAWPHSTAQCGIGKEGAPHCPAGRPHRPGIQSLFISLQPGSLDSKRQSSPVSVAALD